MLWGVMILGVGCIYDNIPEPTTEWPEAQYSTTIAEMKALLDEHSKLPEGVEIVGRVSANDLEGNFYRRIIVEDNTGAVEILVSLYDLHALYPVGCGMIIRCDGLVAGEYNGVMQLGRAKYEWSDYRVEPLSTRREIDFHLRVCSPVTPLEPQTTSLSLLSEADCGELVRIEGATFQGEESDWGSTDYGSEADRMFLSRKGERFVVRTSRYADFATSPIPHRQLSLTGILYRDRVEGEDIFVLKMRSLDDVE